MPIPCPSCLSPMGGSDPDYLTCPQSCEVKISRQSIESPQSDDSDKDFERTTFP